MMSLRNLHQLVRRFVNGDMGYDAFRAEFINYLSVVHRDQVLDDLVNSIESACADLDEGDISNEGELKGELATLIEPMVIRASIAVPVSASRSSLAIFPVQEPQPA